jgi:hypothetical protein
MNSHLKRFTCFCQSTICSVSFGFGQAQSDQDLTSLDLRDLAQVKVYSSSRHEDAREAPSSVTVIMAEEIRHYGWRTLAGTQRNVASRYRGILISWLRTPNGLRCFLLNKRLAQVVRIFRKSLFKGIHSRGRRMLFADVSDRHPGMAAGVN